MGFRLQLDRSHFRFPPAPIPAAPNSNFSLVLLDPGLISVGP